VLVGDRGETRTTRILGFAGVQGRCGFDTDLGLRRFTRDQDDITLVIDNAIKYNKYDTQFYKVATRLRAMSKVVLPQLNNVVVPRHLQGPAPHFTVDQEEVDPSAQYAEASDRLGDLEPPLQHVELLFSNEVIREHEDMEFLLDDRDPISALVEYELGVAKRTEPSPPPSPSPPPPLPLPSSPAKKGKAKGKSKKKGAKNQAIPMDAEQLAILDNTPGFRAPRLRVGDESEEHIAESSMVSVHAETGNENPDAQSITESRGKKGKGKAKVHAAPAPTPIPIAGEAMSGMDHEPHLTETIDKQQSFKMFNEGWILPPDQKRGGRVRVERPPPLPPKKKKSCAHCPILVRVLLTYFPAADRPSISKSPPHQPVEVTIPPPAEPTEDVMDIDVEPLLQPEIQARRSPASHGAVSDTGLPVQSIQESVDSRGNRIVIIEELDTPATRRERTRRAKAERARLAVEAATHTTNVAEISDSRGLPPAPVAPTQDLGQEESDLSSLSGDSDEVGEDEEVQASTSAGLGRGRGKVQTQRKAGHVKSPGLGNVSLPPNERLESGTLGTPFRSSVSGVASDTGLQFGRNTSRTLGGAPSCMIMTCRRSRRTFCNELIRRETTL
jgi:hypothetical protein